MDNLYQKVKESLTFNKFSLGDLVCVEYSCPVEDEHVGVYTDSDYLIYILSGKKTWRTIQGSWVMEAGQTLFVKKGAAIVTQDFDENFCMLGFFLPDYLIKESLIDIIDTVPIPKNELDHQFTASKLKHKSYLEDFIQSMFPYFRDETEPPEALLKLKLKELLINIIYHCNDPLVKSYLKSVAKNSQPSLTQIMETNFCFNLKLEEFAKMSHRSLSKFKSDFFKHYNMTPGKWLLNKRLDHAANLILTRESNISQVSFESGFEDVSHFSRVFKKKFGIKPSAYSKNLN
jgi:AraC-like DNA-binding protein